MTLAYKATRSSSESGTLTSFLDYLHFSDLQVDLPIY
jgi:hypothetical protein